MKQRYQPDMLRWPLFLAKAIALFSLIAMVGSVVIYILFALKNDWLWAKEPAALASFGDYLSGTFGVFLALVTLSVLVWSIIIQKQDNTDAIKANTKAFVLGEYRAAISVAQLELESKNKEFSIDQPAFHGGSKTIKTIKTIKTTMTLWDFFHGGIRDWAPGNAFESVIIVQGNWNDYFETAGLMDETLRIDILYYAVKITKLRYLIIRYLEEGGFPDVFLEELEDARLSKQYLAGPAFAVKGEIEPSKISKSVIKVYGVSELLIEKMEPMID